VGQLGTAAADVTASTKSPTLDLIGNKRSQAPFIAQTILREVPNARKVADLFCGSGAVSRALKASGIEVVANDHLQWCATFAEAILLNEKVPSFCGIVGRNSGTRAYDDIIRELNELPPIRGFFHREYSPASAAHAGVARMYFTEENAGLIDAIRRRIQEWDRLLTRPERALLISDLIRAADAVSNVAGTYGCYLKTWKPRALQPLTVIRSTVPAGSATGHAVYCMDANVLAGQTDADVLYADPPYTKRQYAAYYHILETIAQGDQPLIEGTTGLRPWRDRASAYCYKRTAPAALEDLIGRSHASHVFLSYNEDGQIPHHRILRILEGFGRVRVFETTIRRYRSSRLPHKGPTVSERLYHLRRLRSVYTK